jgi:hypothetical protein
MVSMALAEEHVLSIWQKGFSKELLLAATPCQQLAVRCCCHNSACGVLQVRRAMAEQLYLQMLAVQPEAGAEDSNNFSLRPFIGSFTSLQQLPAECLEAACDVLLISAWDGPLEQVRDSREALAVELHIEIKTRRVAKVLLDAGAPGVKTLEQESYQSLLDDAARGGGY